MKIALVTHHLGIHGSYINQLDFSHYLRKAGYEIVFYCESVKKLFENIKRSQRKYEFQSGEIKVVREQPIIEPELIVTDFATFCKLAELNISLCSKKILVFDTVELSYHLNNTTSAKYFLKTDLMECCHKHFFNEVLFLMPPSNIAAFKTMYPGLKAEVIFKRINIDLLKTIRCENIDGFFYRWDDIDVTSRVKELFIGNCVSLPEEKEEDLFNFKNLVYYKRERIAKYEQFGRLVFEYILLGKSVYFLDDPFAFNDGMRDYLEFYNIQTSQHGLVTTAKEELEQRMLNYDFRPWEEN